MSDKVILMDAEDSDQALTITYDSESSILSFICDDGTYQEVWSDQLVKAMQMLGVISKAKVK